MTTVPTRQVPGVYHRRIGDIVVTTVSDGFLDSPVETMRHIAPEEATQMLAARFRKGRRTSVNCYLLHSAGRIALVETGCGDYLQPSAGKLMDNIKAAGVDPAAIDTIMLSHMHPDHSNGLMNRHTGEVYFPNATLFMHEKELAHWSDEAEYAKANEVERRLYFDCAREQTAPYKDRIKTFSGEQEIFPGVTAMPLPGHTPGHSGYLIASGGDSVLLWGDIIHTQEVQVPRPEVCMVFDVHPEQAAQTRRQLFEKAVADKQLIGGNHIHFPSFARMVKEDGTFLLVPEPWVHELTSSW